MTIKVRHLNPQTLEFETIQTELLEIGSGGCVRVIFPNGQERWKAGENIAEFPHSSQEELIEKLSAYLEAKCLKIIWGSILTGKKF